MKRVSIIGVGRVGGAIALALSQKDFEIETLISRTPENTKKLAEKLKLNPQINTLKDIDNFKSDIIFITTQDSEIQNVVNQLKDKTLEPNTYVFHTSGSISSEILSVLKTNKCKIGSIHPLVSISDPFLGVKRFKDAYFCVEGETEAVKIANKIVEKLGGKPFSIETKYKTLYHASAVTACGHIVALIDASMEMLGMCGLEEDTSKEILMPLIKSTIENLFQQKTSEALTGTFARADIETLEKHIKTLKENTTEEILEIYLNLGERSLKLAKEQGINNKKLAKMSEKISLAKKKFKC